MSLVDVDREFSRLRSFQRDTARYAFNRLFADGPASTSRFLVADEVGLGKTMVARGVIAQAIQHLHESGDNRIDIVYVCSNSAIAEQNLRKLAPAGVPVEHRTERLPLLAFRHTDTREHPVRIIALTPGTALKKGWSTGWVEERAAVLRALYQLWGGHRLRGRGIGRIFAAGIGPGAHASKDARIRAMASALPALSAQALARFDVEIARRDAEREARGLPDLDTELHDLGARFSHRDDQRGSVVHRRNALVSELRDALAMTGAYLLRPDLVVLDEFQRFRDIIHDQIPDHALGLGLEAAKGDGHRPALDYASEVARQLFDYHHEEFDRRTRVLMLSATPYVMHTTSAEAAAGGDQHYDDFLKTYCFLADGLPKVDPARATAELRADLSRLRAALMATPADGVEPAQAAADAVGQRLRQVMVRTERLAATPDRGGMLCSIDEDLPVPTAGALRQYLDTAHVARRLRSTTVHEHDVVEFWKSAPYTLSYLGAHGYRLADALRTAAGPEAEALDESLLHELAHSTATLPWDRVRDYEPIDVAHSGLAQLWRDLFDDAQAHTLLWLPPSLPYYSVGGPFETPAARRLTKRLIFSAWNLVPTAIATLTSYEAERRLRAAAESAGTTVHRYDDKRRHARRLRFATETQSMAHLQFVVPSPTLARWADPLADAARMRAEGREPTWDALLATVTATISEAIEARLAEVPVSEAGSTAWYTLAPLLLDAERYSIDALHEDDASGALDRHLAELDRLWDLARSGRPEDHAQLPPRPTDLAEVLALRCLAGPPTVLLRALHRLFPRADDGAVVRAAARAATAFRALFNTAEATHVIDAYTPGKESDYWRRVLRYCGHGNLQAVVDEFLAVLVENRGYDRLDDQDAALARAADDVVRSMNVFALYQPAVVSEGDDGVARRWRTQRMRARFALRYGVGVSDDDKQKRATDIGLAFNSPFWPFALASTSVGQEGLDFHVYCHAITHWNLPGNPVDMEQREGRVHRYKGHAVRKNVARVAPFPDGSLPPWTEVFRTAAASRSGESDMVPFWVFTPDGLADPALIERRLPLMPFTREKSIIRSLLASVVHYRLAFGQPRQDELVTMLGEMDSQTRAQLADVRVDLAPPPSSAELVQKPET